MNLKSLRRHIPRESKVIKTNNIESTIIINIEYLGKKYHHFIVFGDTGKMKKAFLLEGEG